VIQNVLGYASFSFSFFFNSDAEDEHVCCLFVHVCMCVHVCVRACVSVCVYV
jgi:hypothetical protein